MIGQQRSNGVSRETARIVGGVVAALFTALLTVFGLRVFEAVPLAVGLAAVAGLSAGVGGYWLLETVAGRRERHESVAVLAGVTNAYVGYLFVLVLVGDETLALLGGVGLGVAATVQTYLSIRRLF